MTEFLRVYRKKTVLFMFVLFLMNFALYFMSCSPEKQITLSAEELTAYTFDYDEYINSVNQKTEGLSILSALSDSYNSEKMRRTSEMYAGLADVHVIKGENRGIVFFIQYRLTDILVLLFMFVTASDFLRERKKGLANMIRTTVYGRGRLYLYRIAVLLVSAVLISALLYGGNFLASYIRFGNPGLSRPLQSLPEFMTCPYRITVGSFLVRMLTVKVLFVFTVSLVFFMLVSVLGTWTAYTVILAFAAAESVLASLIAPVSPANILRYVNIWSVSAFTPYMNECFFFNIFGNAVPSLNVVYTVLLIVSAVAFTAGVFIHSRGYVSGTDVMQKIADRISMLGEKIPLYRTPAGWEMYKSLVKQGGILFIAGAFAVTFALASKYNYAFTSYFSDSAFRTFSGEITEEKFEEINLQIKKHNDWIDHDLERLYDLEKRPQTDGRDKAIFLVSNALDIHQNAVKSLGKMSADMEDALEYTERTGKPLRYINPFGYNFMLEEDKSSTSMASLMILIGIIGAFSGVYAYDRQNNMNDVLRSSYRGRKTVQAAKIIPVFFICALLGIAVHMIQFIQILDMIRIEDINEPVQSLAIRRDFPFEISIKQYLVLLFAVRGVFAGMTGLVCVFISRLCPDTVTAMGAAVFVLAVPSVIVQIIPGADFVNAIYLLNGAGL